MGDNFLAQLKTGFLNEQRGIDQLMSFKIGDRMKEGIHDAQPNLGINTAEAVRWNSKISDQPARSWRSCVREFTDKTGQLLAIEAVEKEMSDDKVVRARWYPIENISTVKLHARRITKL